MRHKHLCNTPPDCGNPCGAARALMIAPWAGSAHVRSGGGDPDAARSARSCSNEGCQLGSGVPSPVRRRAPCGAAGAPEIAIIAEDPCGAARAPEIAIIAGDTGTNAAGGGERAPDNRTAVGGVGQASPLRVMHGAPTRGTLGDAAAPTAASPEEESRRVRHKEYSHCSSDKLH